MDEFMDPMSGIEVTSDALGDIENRQETARWALFQFCIQALISGEDIDCIMDAAKFPENPAGQTAMVNHGWAWSMDVPSRRERFAEWMSREVTSLVVEG